MIKNKEQGINKQKYLVSWGHRINLVWDKKAQSWLGFWEVVDWIYEVSGLAQHLQGCESY